MDLLQVRDLKEQKKHLKKANNLLDIVNRKSGYNYETLYDFLLYGIDDNSLNYYAWLLKRYGFSYEEFMMPPYFKYSLDISSYFWSNRLALKRYKK